MQSGVDQLTAPASPGVSGALLEILHDPIAALCIARQIDREAGAGTAANLQEAAIRVIAGDQPNEEQNEFLEAQED